MHFTLVLNLRCEFNTQWCYNGVFLTPLVVYFNHRLHKCSEVCNSMILTLFGVMFKL